MLSNFQQIPRKVHHLPKNATTLMFVYALASSWERGGIPLECTWKKIFISANLFHIYCVVSLFLHVRRSHYTEKEESTIAIQHKLWHPYAKWTEATEGWILWSENKWTDSFPSFQEETQTSFRGQCSMKHYANAFQVRHRSLPKRELPIRHGWWFLALEEP